MDVEQELVLLKSLRLRKAAALFVFLISAPQRSFRTEIISELLWPGNEPLKSSSSFRQTIRQIRLAADQIGPLDINVYNEAVSVITPSVLALDARLVELLLTDPTNATYRGHIRDYLAQLSLLQGLTDGFDNWLVFLRNRAITLIVDALEQLATTAQGENEFQLAQLIAEAEPHNETAARCMMRYHWKSDQANRAIEVYNALYAYVDQQYDQEPEAETIELLAAIKMDPHRQSNSQNTHLKRPLITLQVLASGETSPDRLVSSLQTVLIRDLRMRLSRFREWQIQDKPAQGSSFMRIHIELIGGAEELKLNIEVIDPNNNALIWSEIIDNPNINWERKVRILVINIANALRIVVSDRMQYDSSAKIYDRWLETQALIGTWTQPDQDKAAKILTSITQEVTDFGPAHAELASLLNVRHILRPGTFQSEDLKLHALDHALEAVSIDPMDTRSHRVLAWCYCHRGKFDIAEFHFEQSLLLNPLNTHSLASSALGFAFVGNNERASVLMAELQKRPQSLQAFHLTYMAATNYLCGHYEQAAQQCQNGPNLMSTVGGWHTAALFQIGQHQQARKRLNDYVQEISAQWQGPAPATAEDVINWFVSCFPLRENSVRQALKETLLSAQAISV